MKSIGSGEFVNARIFSNFVGGGPGTSIFLSVSARGGCAREWLKQRSNCHWIDQVVHAEIGDRPFDFRECRCFSVNAGEVKRWSYRIVSKGGRQQCKRRGKDGWDGKRLRCCRAR